MYGGEQPLPPNGCCDLGPINLTKFVINPFLPAAYFDFNELALIVKDHVRFLDNVLDVTHWPLESQKKESEGKRRIGIGFTGLGNALAMLGLNYDSKEACEVASTISITMRDFAYDASVDLAIEKGQFPLLDREKFLEEGTAASRLPIKIKERIRKHGIRNSHLLSIAPVGTVSLAFCDNASNGIEPPFSLSYKRRKRITGDLFQEYFVVDHGLRVFLNTIKDPECAQALFDAICNNKVDFVFNDNTYKTKDSYPKSLVTAQSMTVEAHLNMMKAVQPYVCTSISKTVNIPEDYPFDDFKNVYDLAHSYKLKGVATYRPNSTLGSILSVTTEVKKEEPKTVIEEAKLPALFEDPLNKLIKQRPENELESITKKVRYSSSNGDESFYVTVSFMKVSATIDDLEYSALRPIEVFLTAYPDGVPGEWIAVYGRNLSLLARAGLGIFCKSLEDSRKIKSDKGRVRYGWYTKPDGTKVPRFHDSDVACIAFAIQEILISKKIIDWDEYVISFKEQAFKSVKQEEVIVEETKYENKESDIIAGKPCKECGAHAVIKKDGCDFCTNCGMMGTCG